MREKIKGIIGRALICVAVCALLFGAVYALLHAFGITDVTREEIQAFVTGTGVWAPLVFILISFLQVTFIPIPSTVTVLAGAYIFGAFPSFFYSYIGICLGSILAFELGRGIGRPFARWVVGSEEELDSWVGKLKGRERALLWIIFFFPFFPDDAICTVAGLLKVSRIEFLLMQLITRTTSIGSTLIFMSGEVIPYEGFGIVVIAVGALLFVAASVLSLIYFEKIDALARSLADRLTGRGKSKKTDKKT